MRKLAAAVAALVILGSAAWIAVRFATAPSPPASVAVGSTYPASYAVVYQVNQRGTRLWEVLRMDRPLSGSDLTYATRSVPGPGDSPVSGSISTPTALYAVSANGVQLVSGRQPGPPSADQYLGQEIGELTSRGLAQPLGDTVTVAGRACAEYRFAGPPTGPIPSVGSGDHDDLCLDISGLVLREEWTYHGQVVETRSAVRVETADTSTQVSDLPAVPSLATASPASAAEATAVPDPHATGFIAQPPAPNGFTAAGPAIQFRLPDPSAPSSIEAQSIVWAFTEGARVITVEAGSQRGGLPWHDGDTVTTAVNLAGLGPAQTAIRSDGYQVRIDLGGGQWVRVLGTVPLSQLVTYCQLLTRA